MSTFYLFLEKKPTKLQYWAVNYLISEEVFSIDSM